METRCVIDDKGNYITTVAVDVPSDCIDSDIVWYYTLTDDQQLLNEPPPTEVKPRWTGTTWEETATQEEIAAHRAAQQDLLAQSTN